MHYIKTAALGGIVAVSAAAGDLPLVETDGCMAGPMAQFGRYIGRWNIADSQLQQDGSTWVDGPGARWDFVCVGDGAAIQDFWMPNGGNVGTNLRTYNAETESWDIAWAVKPQPGFAHITARQNDEGAVVMRYKTPLPDPPRRITFFPPDEHGWNWRLEMSFDKGETWNEVYRIKATPVE